MSTPRQGALIRAEWLKVATTKITWILVLASAAFVAFSVTMTSLALSGRISRGAAAPAINTLILPESVSRLVALASSATTFVLLIGIIAMTSEYRHMTITSAYLVTPHRWRVLAAKCALFAAIGAVVAVITVAASTTATALSMIGVEHAPLTSNMVFTALLGAVIGMTLYAVIGVSVGALIRNQVAAIMIAIVWSLLIEGIVSAFLPDVARWLPGGALSAAMDVTTRTDMSGQTIDSNLLPVWGGILLLVGYAAAFAIIASRTSVRRDVT